MNEAFDSTGNLKETLEDKEKWKIVKKTFPDEMAYDVFRTKLKESAKANGLLIRNEKHSRVSQTHYLEYEVVEASSLLLSKEQILNN